MAEPRELRAALICAMIFLFIACLPAYAGAHGITASTEIGIGGGLDIEDLNTHPSFIMARTFRRSDIDPDLLWGVEWNLLLIDTDKTTCMGSVLPFFRKLWPEERGRAIPFFELGMGAGLTNHNEVNGRKLGGKFMFTIESALGLEVSSESFGDMALSARYLHFSNGGLYPFNQSYNAVFLTVSRIF